MNAKVILYLFQVEWRRLRIWLSIFWLLLLLEALPHLVADFDLLSGVAKLLGRQYHHFSGAENLKQLVWSDVGEVFPKWMFVLMSMNGAASVMAIIVSSVIGMEVLAGLRLRPVRVREEVAAKAAALALLVILPVVMLVALNLSLKGFDFMTVVDGAGRSALVLAPMVTALAIFGRVCGGFWRWVGGMVGFLALIVISPMLGAWYVPFPKFDLWGADDHAWRMGAALLVVLALVLVFKGRAKSFRPILIALPLMLAALIIGFYADKAEEAKRIKLSSLPEVSGLQVDGPTIDGSIHAQHHLRGAGVSLSGDIKVDGVPDGYFVNWTAEGEVTSPPDKDRQSSRHARLRSTLTDWRFATDYRSMYRELPSSLEISALRAAMGDKGATLPKSQESFQPSYLSERISFRRVAMRAADKELLDRPVDVEVSLTGLVFRYRLAENLPLDAVREYGDGLARVRIRSSLIAPDRVSVDLSMMQDSDPDDRVEPEPQVVIWDPESGISTQLTKSEPIRSRLLAHCWFRLTRYYPSRSYPQDSYNRFRQMNHSKARVLVYMPEVLGRARRETTVAGVSLKKTQQGGSRSLWNAGFSPVNAQEFFSRYPIGRPDPATCTAEEAGKWISLVMTQIPPYEPGWAAKEIACFVPRHSAMILRFPENILGRQEMIYALSSGLPEEGNLVDAMAAADPGYGFDALYQVARRRGWEEKIRDSVLRRTSQGQRPNWGLMMNSMAYGDRSKYPDLIARLSGTRRWDLYQKVRELPGIEPALTEAIRLNESEARKGGETDPNAYAIPAAHGSRDALRTLLSTIEPFGQDAHSWDDAAQVLSKATYVPFDGRRGPGFYFARLKEIGADALEWDPFLRLWIVKESQP
jgi:hypothetical protein